MLIMLASFRRDLVHWFPLISWRSIALPWRWFNAAYRLVTILTRAYGRWQSGCLRTEDFCRIRILCNAARRRCSSSVGRSLGQGFSVCDLFSGDVPFNNFLWKRCYLKLKSTKSFKSYVLWAQNAEGDRRPCQNLYFGNWAVKVITDASEHPFFWLSGFPVTLYNHFGGRIAKVAAQHFFGRPKALSKFPKARISSRVS